MLYIPIVLNILKLNTNEIHFDIIKEMTALLNDVYIKSIFKKERIPDTTQFDQVILKIDDAKIFLKEFNEKRKELKISTGDALGLILSYTCFPGIDSFNDDVQYLSLLILQEVLDENLDTELRWYHIPMYEFLLKVLTTRNPKLLKLALDVSFKASEKLENKLTLRPNYFRFLDRLIDYSIHSVREVRYIYASKLELFIRSSEIHIIKYASILFPWLYGLISEGPLSGVEIKEPLPLKLAVIKSFKAIIEYSWPCLNSHKENILTNVCRGVIVNSNLVCSNENDNGNNTTKELIFMEYVNICKILYLVNCLWVDQTLKLMIDTLEKRNKSSKAVVALKSLYKATCGREERNLCVVKDL